MFKKPVSFCWRGERSLRNRRRKKEICAAWNFFRKCLHHRRRQSGSRGCTASCGAASGGCSQTGSPPDSLGCRFIDRTAGWALKLTLGCVNSRHAARGCQEAGFMQPRAHSLAHLCICPYPIILKVGLLTISLISSLLLLIVFAMSHLTVAFYCGCCVGY